MKQHWQKLAAKIDARAPRERTIIFATAAVIVIMLVNAVLLGPQSEKQRQLSMRKKQEEAKIAEIQMQIQKRAQSQAFDPDEESRKRLQALKQQAAQIHATLRDMQKGLVSPDKMAELLEAMLKRNGKLRLLSLKTLPTSGLTEQPAPDAGAKGVLAKALSKDKPEAPHPEGDAVYKHGVEITLQGSYGELLSCLTELEAMPWQLFWSDAKLSVDEYPKTTLTLTLYTLSLDKKWLNI